MNKEFVVSFIGSVPESWSIVPPYTNWQFLRDVLYSRITNISVEAYKNGYSTIKLVSCLDNMAAAAFNRASQLLKKQCSEKDKIHVVLKTIIPLNDTRSTVPETVYDLCINKVDVLLKTPLRVVDNPMYITLDSDITIFFKEEEAIPRQLLIEEEDYQAIVIQPSDVEKMM